MTAWILYDVFGLSDISGVIVIVATITFCLIWLIFLLSKILFKCTFTNEVWENMFIFIVGFPTLMQIFYGSIIGMNALDASHSTVGDQFFYYYSFFDLEWRFFPFLLLFMIAYLIQFMTRLVRHKKQKQLNLWKMSKEES